MTQYYSHGLSINSEMNFPEFTIKKSSHIDVFIRFGEISALIDNFLEVNLSKLTKVRSTSNIINLLWNNIEIFTIKNGKEIIINPQTGLEENFLRYLFMGHVIPILLHQKGRLVLHANAVNMDEGAVILLGSSGKGKSTTSIALHKQNYNLLSDDILSIKIIDEKYQSVYPGFPRIKLWPIVIKNINEDPNFMPKIHFNTEKRSYNISEDFSHDIKPIRAIYLLEEGDKTAITEMKSFDGLLELIKSSYCFKLFNETELSENFKQVSKIVNNIPFKRLVVKPSFENLKNIVDVIENDIFNS